VIVLFKGLCYHNVSELLARAFRWAYAFHVADFFKFYSLIKKRLIFSSSYKWSLQATEHI
jgi:hypothetical protein